MIFTKDDLPLLSGESGKITVDVSACELKSSAHSSSNFFFTTKFGDSDAADLVLGPSGFPKLRIKAGTSANVIAIDGESDCVWQNLLSDFQLNNYLDENPDDILLLLELTPAERDSALVCAIAEDAVSDVAINPTGSVSYSYLRSFPRNAPIEKILKAHLSGVRLPAHLTASPRSGEIIRYQYWGKLNVVNVASEFDFCTTKNAEVLGGFLIEVREHLKTGWVRVSVTKKLTPYRQCVSKLQEDLSCIDWVQIAYNQASEDEVLIDLSINLMTEAGKVLMRAVGQGDFSQVVSNENNNVVTIQRCIFSSSSSLSLCA